MDKAKIGEAMSLIGARIYRATQAPISASGVAELQDALKTVNDEADEQEVLGRQLIDFCDQVELSNLFEARREPATRMEGLVRICESLQRQLTA